MTDRSLRPLPLAQVRHLVLAYLADLEEPVSTSEVAAALAPTGAGKGTVGLALRRLFREGQIHRASVPGPPWGGYRYSRLP